MEHPMLKLKPGCLISHSFLAQRYLLKPVAGSPGMHAYLRNKPAWMQLIIFGGLTVGILFLVLTLGVNLVARFNHLSVMQVASMSPADYTRPELAGVIKGLLVVQFFGIFLLPSLVFAYLTDPRPLAYAGIKAPQKNSFLFIGLITMIAAYFTVELLGMINEAIVHWLPKSTQKWVESGEADANGALENILSMKSPADLIKTIFLVGALPAIGEELFFRGILQKLFIQIFKKAWPGIIFTGFLFSAFHMQFMGFLPRMALGIILGSLYWYSGSLITSMLGHFIFNTINILLIYFKFANLDSKSSSGLVFNLFGLASFVVIVLLLNYLKKKSTTTYAGEFPPVNEISIFDEGDNPA
jgi:membrane protease YdiL (CAAX protease family)